MTTQRIDIGSIVRSVLLIAIGIVIGVGISIGVGIGRIGITPASVSRVVGQSDRYASVRNSVRRGVPFDVSVERDVRAARFNVGSLDLVAVDVVGVNLNDVHVNTLLG